MALPKPSTGNQIVILTVGMVVVAGVLSALGACIQVERARDSYDEAIEMELQQKGYGIASTATFFLDSLGPSALTSLEGFTKEGFAQSEDVVEGRTDIQGNFSNVFLKLEVWYPTEEGFTIGYQESLAESELGNQVRGRPDVVASVARSDVATSTIDEDDRVLEMYVPFSLDANTRLVLVGTLDAQEEFSFFAAQRATATRDGILIFVAITVFVSLIGAALSVLVSRTLTSRKRVEESLREQARRDLLTGSLNHGAIIDELRERTLSATKEPFAVVMADVDGMKATNDTYGHAMGDRVLRIVARALAADNAVLGRYGGDEFVSILPGANPAAALEYSSRVAASLRGAKLTDALTGAQIPVSATLGVSFYPDDAGTVLDLINVSDTAMYAARRQRPIIVDGEQMPTREDLGAARVVAELIPLLAAEGTLEFRLHQFGHRLCTGAGYAAVTITLYAEESHEATISTTVGSVAEDVATEWDRIVEGDDASILSLRKLIERGRKPLIFNDLQSSKLLSPELRDLLKRGHLKSGILVPMLWQERVIGSLSIASPQANAFGPKDAQFLVSVATQVTAIVRMAKLVEDLSETSGRLADARDETVMLLAAAAEAHDPGMSHHFEGVRGVAEKLATELGYSEHDVKEAGLAAALHDVGKIRVPPEALANHGPLSPEQWELMKQHTIWGEAFFRRRTGFQGAAVVARSHHEHWSGEGYPDGLMGEQIPELAAITGVADAFDAMVNQRPYSSARSVDEAIQEIAAASGTQFSPRVVDALLRLHRAGHLPHLHGESQQVAA